MERLTVPELPHIVNDGFVTVSSKQFQEFVDYVNKVVACLNLQSTAITALKDRLIACEQNTAKVAEIVREIYETL